MSKTPEPIKFGTFGGVFTPCTLTILGVIMFLRFGEVVGQAGLINALLIIAASKAITLLTSLSLSAIATNTKVKGGGAYYLISRSLGVEFGGAIGVVFYLAQAISVAMYVIGFTEAFVGSFNALSDNFTEVATVVNIICFICVYIGAGWTIKVQYFILGVLGLALLSFGIGAVGSFQEEILRANLVPHFSEGYNFYTMFALFFPAVTGIMAGANMSGDLINPARSIPRGTLFAVFVTAIVYVVQAILLAGSRGAGELVSNNLIIRDISYWPFLIYGGMYAATLSSALGSMMGAPRILQAFSRDEVIPIFNFFAPGSGPSSEPRRATVLTFIIAEVCILLGDLNAIAPVITLFFMITYGLINLATFYEGVSKNPSYRPTFKYCHWFLSLLGAVGCLVVMFLTNWLWAIASILIIFLLHKYIEITGVEARWGDLKMGVAFERARLGLVKLQEYSYHPKNWRPNVLALTGVGWTKPHIPLFGQWLTAGHGILTLAQVIKGDPIEHASRLSSYEATIKKLIENEGIVAFPRAIAASDLLEGAKHLLQCHGVGSFRANTLLLSWPQEKEKLGDFFSIVKMSEQLDKSVVAVKINENLKSATSTGINRASLYSNIEGTIDVWWRGKNNGSLMLILAHLLHQNAEWRSCKLRVIRVIDKEAGREDVRRHIEELAEKARMHVEPLVFTSESLIDDIGRISGNSEVVFFGFKLPEDGKELEFYQRLEVLSKDLPRVLFVHSVGGVELEI